MNSFILCLQTIICMFTNQSTLKSFKYNSFLEEQQPVYVIRFDYAGGNYFGATYQDVLSSNIKDQETVNIPIKDYCTFLCWVDEYGNRVNLDTLDINSNLTVYAHWQRDYSYLIIDEKYAAYYNKKNDKAITDKYLFSYFRESTELIKKTIDPINNIAINEINGPNFPGKIVENGLGNSSSTSKYGGCGPIAMIGILDYFSNYNHLKMLEREHNDYYKTMLSANVFNSVNVINIGEDTPTLPWAYVEGFERVLKQYNYSNEITVQNHSSLTLFSSSLKQIIKENIDNNMPVTLYTAFDAGPNECGAHYMNIYGYIEYSGINHYNKNETLLLLIIRPNLGYNFECYCDSNILNHLLSGIITYEITDSNISLYADDFKPYFINPNGMGQYYFDEKETILYKDDNFLATIKRKRCTVIDGEYLVLSANRVNAGDAYIDFTFNNKISGVNVYLSLWSNLERLSVTEGDTVTVEVYKNGNYIVCENISLVDIPASKIKNNKFEVKFDVETYNFRIHVHKNNPDSKDRNKGRVIIHQIDVYYT